MDRGQALCRSGRQVLVGPQVSLILIGWIPAPVPGDHQFQERSADALQRRDIGTVHALPALHPDRQSSDYLPLLIHLLKIFKRERPREDLSSVIGDGMYSRTLCSQGE